MQRYGQSLVFGTATVPDIFTGSVLSYSLRNAVTRQLIPDGNGDNTALALHSAKGELNFEVQVTDGSTNFLDLSTGGRVVVSTLTSGTVLATRAVETWALGQDKRASLAASYYPDFVDTTGALAGTDLNALTPEQTLAFVFPGSKIVYGTAGLGHASGVVHGVTIEQQLSITDDEPSPVGTILGATTHGYLRMIRLDLLASPTVAAPAVQSELIITGAPDHMAGHRIEASEFRFATLKGKRYLVNSIWIPGMVAA
ncbi:MAG: hypothetical protein ABIT76_08615 [Chthoniobacterales bacterium]